MRLFRLELPIVRVPLALAVLLVSRPGYADDWSSRGLDPAHLRASTEKSGAAFRAQPWTYRTPGALWNTSSPAVADGIAVFGARDGTIHAVRASTGRGLWQFKAKDSILASPAIHKGRVFVPSLDNKIYALRLADGTVAWTKDLGGLEQSSPMVIGDSIIVAGGFPLRQLFRIDVATGETIWKTSPEVMAQFSNSSAVSDGTQVLVGAMEGHLYSFDLATGAHRWTYEADGIVNLTVPAIVGDRVYLLPGGDSGRLHAIDLATGTAAPGWPVALPEPATDSSVPGKLLLRARAVSSLAAVADRLFFDVRFDDSLDENNDAAPDRFLMREFAMAVSASDGHLLWQQANGRTILDSASDMPKNWLCPTPATYRSMSHGAPSLLVASTLLASVQTLDSLTGTSRGNTAIDSPTRISPVLANGRLIVGTDSGVVHGNLSNSNQPPDAPTLLIPAGRPIGNVKPTIRWSPALDRDGDAVSYQLRLDHDGELLENSETELTTGPGETSTRLTRDLAPGVTYVLAVRARDARGAWSDWSLPRFVRAEESPTISVEGTSRASLAEALASAVAGSIIKLGPGTFYLSETLRVPAGVSLEGAGPQKTILDGTGQPVGVSLEGNIEGQPTGLKNVTVTGAQVGVAVRDTHDARIQNVVVRDNRETGIEVSAAGSATLENATVAANVRGVRSFGAITVRNSIVTGNQTGFVSDHVDAITSRFNDLAGNAVPFQGMARGTNDLIQEVAFANYPKRDLHLLPGQPSTDKGDPSDDFALEPAPNGGRINLGAFGGTAEAEPSVAAAAQPVPPAVVPKMSGGCSLSSGEGKGEGEAKGTGEVERAGVGAGAGVGAQTVLMGLAALLARRRRRGRRID